MAGKMIAGMYDLDETLGSGHFAVVKLARHVITGEHVAVKVIDKTKLDKVARDHLFQEVRCMKLVQHASIIRLYQVIDTQTKLYLILELGENGDLYEYISKHDDGVGEEEGRDLFRQIAEAIAYCHRLHVVHRDLKPENVVFCDNASRVKLTDFGLSNLFAPGEKLKTSCGSLSYAAPEILLGDLYDGPAVDIWSLGVILYMLLAGKKPFVGGTDSETLTMIMDCKFRIPSHLSEESADLLRHLLVAGPEDRLPADKVILHPWIRDHHLDSPPSEEPKSLSINSRLNEDDRRTIIQRMAERGVADIDTINRSLDSNAYDHIAATFYLMAETHLKTKDDFSVNPVSDLDMLRLDRRRQHVRKLSTPGMRVGGSDTPGSFTEPTTPNVMTPPSRVLTSHSAMREGLYSPSPSPGITIRRGAAESGVLRRATRRSTLTSAQSPLANSYCPTPEMSPMGNSLRRASLSNRLPLKTDENLMAPNSFNFVLPLSSSSSCSTQDDDMSPSPPLGSPTGAGTPVLSLMCIGESESESSERLHSQSNCIAIPNITSRQRRDRVLTHVRHQTCQAASCVL